MHALDLTSLFLLGFLGSGHCVGMCGPIVLALPRGASPTLGQLAYHAGRVLTYSLIGAALAGVGAGLLSAGEAAADPLAGVKRVQLAVSLVAAVGLVIFGLSRLGVMAEPGWLHAPAIHNVPLVGRWVKALAGRRGFGALFGFGLLMGFLPCGLSFAAFARALPTGDPLAGALGILAFGAGTLPALLLVGTVGAGFLRKHQQLSNLLSGLIMLGMGISLGADGVLGVL
ncbi:MAG: sulfite exporter TauE/SafE family protein [Myxococcales bacterium]|nr:sulfite exporter TauE/SafE family protein [Myxococcales bacterium]MCB9526070.1 sulfite exporter TauE/SafE family protein [Myxococcales bacterium]